MNSKNITIVVWFSCGAASAVAAKKTIEVYPDANIRIVNFPIAEEDSDNRRFLRDVEAWLGHPIEVFVNPKYPNMSAREIWEKGFMSSPYGAPCTTELKKRTRQLWESQNPVDYHVLGFTFEEKARAERFQTLERENLIPILVDLQISKSDCFRILSEAGIKLPRLYYMGYPNANCIGCVKSSSPTYWNLVREKHPDVFNDRAVQSRSIGCRLVRVKGERIFLDELDPSATGVS